MQQGELLAYNMPITRIIEDNSLKDMHHMRHHMDSNRKVTISRDKLLEQLRTNLEEHKAIYAEALEGYRIALKRELQLLGELLVDTAETLDSRGAEEFQLQEFTRKADRLRKPECFEKAYTEALELFTWDEQPVVQLTVDEFRKFVMDRWDWQENFLATSAGFASENARRKLATY